MTLKKAFFLTLILNVLILPFAAAQEKESAEKDPPGILAVVRDDTGSILEGILQYRPDEIVVTSRENKEESIPSKLIKAITLEKVKTEGPVSLDPNQDHRYSVRVRNSQEIYTLKKKYTVSLSTSLGVVTKSIDPEVINNILSKESSAQVKADKDKP
ncbi:MAG TPA: hypothetical protein VLS90_21400, partial [Thermodesulfobacteriota bacterium]|nr:hypothetical protein [Thermodesulfobacteriota bacterium]